MCVSVEHDDGPRMGAVRGVVLESQYLLEPCGTGGTRLTHISRVDLRCGDGLQALSWLSFSFLRNNAITNVPALPFSCFRGRSPEWYNKVFGYLCVNEAQRIRSSFHPPDLTSTEAKI